MTICDRFPHRHRGRVKTSREIIHDGRTYSVQLSLSGANPIGRVIVFDGEEPIGSALFVKRGPLTSVNPRLRAMRAKLEELVAGLPSGE